MPSIPQAAQWLLQGILWAHAAPVCKLGGTFQGQREKVATRGGWSSFGEMREEWEIHVKDKDWLLDLCVFVSVSSWRLKAWQNWCITSPHTMPAIPLCTSSAEDWLLAQPLLQFNLLTRYARALLLRVSLRYGWVLMLEIIIHSSSNISCVWV